MEGLPLFSTPPEVAKTLRVKASRVRGWIERGELHASNLGDAGRPRYRIARADLQAFLDRRARSQTLMPKPRKRARQRESEQLVERY